MASQHAWVCALVSRKIKGLTDYRKRQKIFGAVLSELQLILIVPTEPTQGSYFCSIYSS
jgi:hypothetical protein